MRPFLCSDLLKMGVKVKKGENFCNVFSIFCIFAAK